MAKKKKARLSKKSATIAKALGASRVVKIKRPRSFTVSWVPTVFVSFDTDDQSNQP